MSAIIASIGTATALGVTGKFGSSIVRICEDNNGVECSIVGMPMERMCCSGWSKSNRPVQLKGVTSCASLASKRQISTGPRLLYT